MTYWSIGNEPTLFAQETGQEYDTARFNADWLKFAEAMKAVNPAIKLIGPELHQYAVDPDARPKDSKGLDWMDEFLKANSSKVDVVTFHRYPYGTNPSKEDLRQNAKVWDDLVIALRGRIHELTGRDIPIAITEVNTNYNRAVGGEATAESHFNAVWLADVVGQMAQQRLFMFNGPTVVPVSLCVRRNDGTAGAIARPFPLCRGRPLCQDRRFRPTWPGRCPRR